MSQKPLKTGLQQATCTLVAECLVRALQYLSTADSKIQVWVIPTNEELAIARDTLEIATNK